MTAHTPVLLRCLASGHSLNAAYRISATTHRTECYIVHRTSVETSGVKCCQYPDCRHSWDNFQSLPPAPLPSPGYQIPALAASCLTTAPFPLCLSPDVSGVFPSSSLSLTCSLLSSPTSRLPLCTALLLAYSNLASFARCSSKINWYTNCMVRLSLLVEVAAEGWGPV